MREGSHVMGDSEKGNGSIGQAGCMQMAWGERVVRVIDNKRRAPLRPSGGAP